MFLQKKILMIDPKIIIVNIYLKTFSTKMIYANNGLIYDKTYLYDWIQM
jgi:hypothetical protein